MRTKKNYRKQRNFCVSLLRKKKREKNCFENLDTKNISDNKTFWKTMRPLLSNNCRLPVNVTLVKETDVFNDFFINAVKNLNITVSGDILCDENNIKYPLLKAIEKYKKHPSIKAIAGIGKTDNFLKKYPTKKFSMK